MVNQINIAAALQLHASPRYPTYDTKDPSDSPRPTGLDHHVLQLLHFPAVQLVAHSAIQRFSLQFLQRITRCVQVIGQFLS